MSRPRLPHSQPERVVELPRPAALCPNGANMLACEHVKDLDAVAASVGHEHQRRPPAAATVIRTGLQHCQLVGAVQLAGPCALGADKGDVLASLSVQQSHSTVVGLRHEQHRRLCGLQQRQREGAIELARCAAGLASAEEAQVFTRSGAE